MFLIREVVSCKPGKVRAMVEKFNKLGGVMESVDDFLEMEKRVMSDAQAQELMAGYHELVESGRREIYRVEA